MVEAKESCKLCNKEFKNLGSHLRAGHQLTMDQYEAMTSMDTEVTDEIQEFQREEKEKIPQQKIQSEEPRIKVTQKERENGILNVDQRFSEEMTVGELLQLKGLTLKELGSLINKFQTGTDVPIVQKVKRDQELGEKGALKLAEQPNPTTTDLHIAEALVKKFGFTVTQITRNPKTWHLTK